MKISVVVPVFNAEPWIEETLNSVRQQGDEIEVIVVDDGSRDHSVEIAREFLDRNDMPGEVLTSDAKIAELLMLATSAGNTQQRNGSNSSMQMISLLRENSSPVRGRANLLPDDVAVLYSPWQRIGLFKTDGVPLDRSFAQMSTRTRYREFCGSDFRVCRTHVDSTPSIGSV
jgi:glycosyltransferase involved in cell wall biosynthesis